jgi:hypothetical protein
MKAFGGKPAPVPLYPVQMLRGLKEGLRSQWAATNQLNHAKAIETKINMNYI